MFASGSCLPPVMTLACTASKGLTIGLGQRLDATSPRCDATSGFPCSKAPKLANVGSDNSDHGNRKPWSTHWRRARCGTMHGAYPNLSSAAGTWIQA